MQFKKATLLNLLNDWYLDFLTDILHLENSVDFKLHMLLLTYYQ